MLPKPILTSEDELILLCARTDMDRNIEKRINRLINDEIDWKYVLKKASNHGLKPLLYLNLKKYQNQIPIDWSLFNQYFSNNTGKNLFYFGEMIKIIKNLKDSNIIAIPYKGPVLARYTYGSLALREFDDIDIYIEKKNVLNVKKIFKSKDYIQYPDLEGFKEKKYLKTQRELIFEKNNLLIEVQWNVTGFSFSFPNESYFPLNKKNFKTITVNEQEIKIFSDEDMILILSVHNAGHLWGRLSWLCDIAELIKNNEELNWQFIIDKARYLAIERILYLNLLLITNLFGVKLPNKVQECIKNDPVIKDLEEKVQKNIFDSENINFINKVILRFKIRENKINGFKDIFRILTIPQSHEWKSFENDKPMLISYLFTRPTQLIKRLKKL